MCLLTISSSSYLSAVFIRHLNDVILTASLHSSYVTVLCILSLNINLSLECIFVVIFVCIAAILLVFIAILYVCMVLFCLSALIYFETWLVLVTMIFKSLLIWCFTDCSVVITTLDFSKEKLRNQRSLLLHLIFIRRHLDCLCAVFIRHLDYVILTASLHSSCDVP